jgi:phosphate transport system substrate-binding protein
MEAKAQSQGVSGFVAQDTSEGAITYVEYSYARNARFPVAKVLNKANYYVEPKAGSVAVALLRARIHPDLTQDLSQVYVDTDPRTYPLSSYSYMILPKDITANFSAEKGRSLSEFAAYFLCEGQQQADTLGYSPLPINLVQAGVDQINQIPGSTKKLDRNNLAHCNNPTVSPDGGNKVAQDAPQPSPCDRMGAPTQCATGTGGAPASTPTKGVTGSDGLNPGIVDEGGANSGGTDFRGTDSGGADSGSANSGSTGTSTAAIDQQIGGPQIDPDTGQVIGGSALRSGLGSSSSSAVPVSVDAADDRRQLLLAGLTVIVLLALALGPALLAYRVRSRQGRQT